MRYCRAAEFAQVKALEPSLQSGRPYRTPSLMFDPRSLASPAIQLQRSVWGFVVRCFLGTCSSPDGGHVGQWL